MKNLFSVQVTGLEDQRCKPSKIMGIMKILENLDQLKKWKKYQTKIPDEAIQKQKICLNVSFERRLSDEHQEELKEMASKIPYKFDNNTICYEYFFIKFYIHRCSYT